MTRRIMPWVLMGVLVCCASPGVPPPPTVHTVAVLTPSNRTSNELFVTGGSLLERYAFHTDRVTVADVLAIELRAELTRRGFAVVAPEVVESAMQGRRVSSVEGTLEIARQGDLHDPVLFTAIDQWQTDGGSEPDFIIVAADAALIDPASGKILWRVHRRARPVNTPGSVTLGSAYEIAAEKLAAELLDAWETPR